MSAIVKPPTREQMQQQITWLEAEIERLRAEVERQDKQNAAFSDTICERDDTIERLKAEKARMEAALQPLVLKHVELEAENKRLRAELEQVREILSDRENEITRLRAFYNEAVRTIEQLRAAGGKDVMSQEMALILLRSGQMTEADYVQRARENRWPPIK